MPSDLGGLALVVIFAVPGLLYFVRRRAKAPQRPQSAFVETASFVAVSTFTNLAALGVFALIRHFTPDHTPNVQNLLRSPREYVLASPGYVLSWGTALLLFSSGLAFAWASQWGPFGWLSNRFTPTIVDVSAWYWAAENGPSGARVHVGCDMADGTYLAGFLAWYSTELDETGDRELVLTDSLESKRGGVVQPLGCSRVVVAARDIRRIYITYVESEIEGAGAG